MSCFFIKGNIDSFVNFLFFFLLLVVGILDKLPADERDRLENVKTSMEFSEDSEGDR